LREAKATCAGTLVASSLCARQRVIGVVGSAGAGLEIAR
jgi:hypothetical protein